MAEFTATARIPCRPLSYDNKDLAEPKELIVDYATGNVWVSKADGTLVDVGSAVKEIILEYIKEDPEFGGSITIEIDGVPVELQVAVAQNTTNIKTLFEALGYYEDPESHEPKFDLLDKIANYNPETGDITISVSADDITETDDKQFVTQEEKDKIANATHPEIITATILGGASAWTGSSAPYTQQVTVAGILESDTPVVDITLPEIYETVQKQLDSWAYIYKILTYDGYIKVYASEPTQDDVNIQMKVDR